MILLEEKGKNSFGLGSAPTLQTPLKSMQRAKSEPFVQLSSWSSESALLTRFPLIHTEPDARQVRLGKNNSTCQSHGK